MAWVAVDSDGDEYVYSEYPERILDFWAWPRNHVILPKGSIKKLIGR